MNVKHVLIHAETMEDAKMFQETFFVSVRMDSNRILTVTIVEISMSVQDGTWTYVLSQACTLINIFEFTDKNL